MTLPDGWTKTTIGAIAKVTSGGTPSRKIPDYWDGDIPWVTTSLIDFNTIDATEQHITRLGVDNSSAKLFPKGTLLMAMFGQGVTRGKVAMLGIDATFNQACVAIIPRNGESSRFLFHNLATRYDEIRRLSNTGSQENLNAALIKSIEVLWPKKEEIAPIVTVADCWDRGIRQLSDLIAAKVRFKQGLMQQLLTGTRRCDVRRRVSLSPPPVEAVLKLGLSATAVEVERGLNGKSYDEGIPKLESCPQGWRMVKLQELLSLAQRPVRLQRNHTYKLVTAKRYRAGIVPREELRGGQIKTTTQFEAKAGDFLISRRQIVHGACGLVPASLDGAIVSNEYSCLRISGELDPTFFEYLTHTKYMQRTFYQSSVGVTVEKMIFRIEHWLRYGIHLPPLAEQKRIVALLAAVDREIILLDSLEKALAEQKKGLMQKLLTGQIRVTVK